MNVTVEEVSEDRLSREVWLFKVELRDEKLKLKLVSFKTHTRRQVRSKWCQDRAWLRYEPENCNVAKPTPSDEMLSDIRCKIFERLGFERA